MQTRSGGWLHVFMIHPFTLFRKLADLRDEQSLSINPKHLSVVFLGNHGLRQDIDCLVSLILHSDSPNCERRFAFCIVE